MSTTAVILDADDLHASLREPLLDAMNFLGQVAAAHPAAISFAAGMPSSASFRTDDLIRHLRTYLDHLERGGQSEAQIRDQLFQYGPTAGLIRDLIAGHLAAEEDIHVAPESIVVTVGAQEAMLITLRALFAKPDDVLLVAAPCYVGITGAAALLGIPVVPVPFAGPGLGDRLAAEAERQRGLGRRPRAFYLTPDHSNPTGHTVTEDERTALLDAADAADLLVIEDSPYRMFSAGEPLRALKARPGGGRVVHIGSFGKTALPGARVGYVVADQQVRGGPLLAAELAKVKSMVTVNTPTLSQAVVAGLLLTNDLRLREPNGAARDRYLGNAEHLLAALEKHFPAGERERLGVDWSVPDGGFFLTLRVAFDADDRALAVSAERHGVLWTPQSYFQPGGDPRTIRLSFSNVGPHEIDEGVSRLAAFIAEATAAASAAASAAAPAASSTAAPAASSTAAPAAALGPAGGSGPGVPEPWTPSARSVTRDYLTLIDDSCVAVLPHALRTFTELGIADALGEGPATTAVLATATGAHPGHLGRLLRALRSTGLITDDADGRWSLSGTGRAHLGPGGTARAGVVNTDSAIAWLGATEAIRRGGDAFSTAHESSFFGHKDAGDDANAMFLTRMRERAQRCYGEVAAQADWGRSRTVMDIGGGDGYLLDRILTVAPHVQGMLFDRPAGVALARPRLVGWGDRCTTHVGDFFEGLPSGADTHLLASVLHDWRDDDATTILRHSRAALAPGGRLRIVEMVVPEDGAEHPSVWSDLGMMLLTGGLERTGGEYRELLHAAGFALTAVTPLPGSWFSLLEASPHDGR